MLLPSDIARLVLGYLQEEGLRATTKAFILESSNLKEYAEHSTDDGAIPASVFSLFGKSLITILNEYVAIKAKESYHETQVPAMMTSLWKKLDFTLNQIKSIQNSPAVYHNQRFRTRNGIMNIRGQRSFPSCTRSPSSALLPVQPMSAHYTGSAAAAPQGLLGHSTPVCYSSLQTRPSPLCVSPPQIQDVGRLVISVTRDSQVPDRRIISGPLSPGRRKCDSPRRRGGGLCGPSGTGRAAAPSRGPIPDQPNEELQEAVGENFPQMVIENAREKILNDKSLQEKLAENINKILGSDINPQSSKHLACSPAIPDQSIDDILGLQGEIHMSDDAIRDILEQTESDPAFQALFDLFDYGKSKDGEMESQLDTSLSTSAQESDEADSSSHFGDLGTIQEEPISGAEPNSRILRANRTQDLKSKKTRKAAVPVSSTSNGGPAPARRGNSRTKARAVEAGAAGCSEVKSSTAHTRARNKDRASATAQGLQVSAPSEENSCMEMPEAVETTVLPASSCPVQSEALQLNDLGRPPAPEERGGESAHLSVSSITSVSPSAAASASADKLSGGDQCSGPARMLESGVQAEAPRLDATSKTLGVEPPISPVRSQPDSPHRPHQSRTAGFRPSPAHSQGEKAISAAEPPGPPSQDASSVQMQPVPVPNTPLLDPDPSKIISFRIIVSDEADNQSADSTLSQAVSSITGEGVAAIVLSSPAKSPAKPTSAAATSITQEETAQAVCSLQGADLGPLTGKAGGAVVGMPCLATEENLQLAVSGELSQESGYIQLVPGATADNFFIVADPITVSQQKKVMVLPACSPLGLAPPASHLLTTPPRSVITVPQETSQTYASGSTLFISSPSQPMLQGMMVPVSVVSPSSVGKLTVVQNQLLPVTSPGLKTPVNAKPKHRLAPKDQTGKVAATDKTSKTTNTDSQHLPTVLQPEAAGKVDSSQPLKTAGQQQQPLGDASADHVTAPGITPHHHRRVLCFDVSAGNSGSSHSNVEETLLLSKGLACQPDAPVVTSCSQQLQQEPPSRQSPGSSRVRTVQPAILRGSRTLDGKVRPEAVKSAGKKKPSEVCKESERRATEQSQSLSSSSSQQGIETQGPSSGKDAALTEFTKQKSECRRRSGQSEKVVGHVSDNTKTGAHGHKTTSKSSCAKKVEGKCVVEETEDAQKRKEAHPESRSSSLTPLQITANKENEVEQNKGEQPSAGAVEQEASAPATIGLAAPATQGGSGRAQSMTSPLTKQATEMLQDMQGQNPAATPVKRSSSGSCGLPPPRTPGSGCHMEEPLDKLRTPIHQRPGREGDGTPRHLPPPATPEIPTCSPASETGSESSINMAAHTLMILSRAAIARKDSPLKDSKQQGVAASTASRSKKRKLALPVTSPTSKKETLHSGSAPGKKAKKQKKMLDSFPDDLDVDKFLSSLHYDE
ncbi:hypothetical protein GJAV_G00140450 [Gymnothorax javanicus]|nr:hypothetical protein GJAV_G00140450 [Gymnothorax javanicus]